MKFIFGLIALFCTLVVSAPSWAKTIEVRSENFIFIGDVHVREATALVTELEQYRSAILQLIGMEAFPELIPVRIYSVDGEPAIKEMTGVGGIGGVYKSTVDGPVFILDSKGGFRRGKSARHIALHEYTHHLLATYTNDFYPLWYNEGLANYFSTFEVDKKGQLVIGKPYQAYGYVLAQDQWLPTDVLVNSIRSYPFKIYGNKNGGLGVSDFFYAQSWLAVHYIRNKPGETENLRKYLALFNSGGRLVNVFTQAFGRTPEAFHAELKAYHKANYYSYVKTAPNYDVSVKPLKITKLDKGQAAFHKAEAMRFFSGAGVKTETIRVQLDKAEKILGENEAILSIRAKLAARENKYEEAFAYMHKALAQAPESALVNRTLGILYVDKNSRNDVLPNRKEIDLARTYLMKALRADADDMGSHYNFATTFVLDYETPTGQAIASARTALKYYRNEGFVESNLMFAEILMKAGKYKEAKPAVDRAVVWGRRPMARMQARSMRERIVQHEAGE